MKKRTYTYKKPEMIAKSLAAKAKREAVERERAEKWCGTPYGYVRYHGDSCDKCREAHEAHKAHLKEAYRRPPVSPCGTTTGYKKHLKNGETTCRRCRDANLHAQERWKKNVR